MKTTTILFAWIAITAVASAEPCQKRAKRPTALLTLESITAYKLKWEVGWTNDWRATEFKHADIDHYKRGVVVTWERQERDLKRLRTDAFTLDGKLYWTGEELYNGTKLVARGHVYVSADGVPIGRNMVYLGKKLTDDLLHDYEILYYELELFKNGKPVARYRSSSNFLVHDVDGEISPARIPSDTKLVWGKGPTVRQLIESVPDEESSVLEE